jgi:hypothetical protein
MSVTYVGNSNYHQSRGRNINTLAENDTEHRLGVCGGTCGYTGTQMVANRYRPYQGWATIAPMEMAANSNYNSLQVAMRATAWKNLTVNSTYIGPRLRHYLRRDLQRQQSAHARWDYGPANFDRRQILRAYLRHPAYPNPATGLPRRCRWMAVLRHRQLPVRDAGFDMAPDNLGLAVDRNRANIVPVTSEHPVRGSVRRHSSRVRSSGHFGQKHRSHPTENNGT